MYFRPAFGSGAQLPQQDARHPASNIHGSPSLGILFVAFVKHFKGFQRKIPISYSMQMVKMKTSGCVQTLDAP
jgi:hypothetical protein